MRERKPTLWVTTTDLPASQPFYTLMALWDC